ncbi:FAD-dependent oxidoreductase [Phycicoccus jejuensis]|uniref:FAD-binding protein n=1 Tax=Phycicoccus jejuensis TaxID=367299 RepID=UPI00384F07EB
MFDAVVVGFGLAGAVCAAELLRKGASVLILDAASAEKAGGNSKISGGGFLSSSDRRGTVLYLKALGAESVMLEQWVEESQNIVSIANQYGYRLEKRHSAKADFPEVEGANSIEKWGEELPGKRLKDLQTSVKSNGAVVVNGARVRSLRLDRLGRVDEVHFTRMNRKSVVRSRWGVVLCCGGSAATLRQSHAPPLTLGSPFARGDGARIAVSVGAVPHNHLSYCGPYYAFRYGRTVLGVTPSPLYKSYGRDYLLMDAESGRLIPQPDVSRHGWALSGSRGPFRQRLSRAIAVTSLASNSQESVLGRDAGHAPGYLGFHHPEKAETSLRRALVSIREDAIIAETRSAIKKLGDAPFVGIPVEGAILNTQGGITRGYGGKVWGIHGAIPGLFAAGELGSMFVGRYQGSGNLTDCLLSARWAAEELLKRKA